MSSPGAAPEGRSRRGEDALERLLGATRWVAVLPVVVLLASTVVVFAYASYVAVRTTHHVVTHPLPAAPNVSDFLVVIDLFLVGATTLIAALGFYELFINAGDGHGLVLPRWLEMRDLDDLKTRVVSMVVLVVAVAFVEVLVGLGRPSGVLEVGTGAAAVIAALTLYVHLGGRSRHP
ncbi:MAG TPA: YqhA family protein [Acidimicrobiales bacterium]|nr:YqhA family protein [Acidimicrobiales bacterium]